MKRHGATSHFKDHVVKHPQYRKTIQRHNQSGTSRVFSKIQKEFPYVEKCLTFVPQAAGYFLWSYTANKFREPHSLWESGV